MPTANYLSLAPTLYAPVVRGPLQTFSANYLATTFAAYAPGVGKHTAPAGVSPAPYVIKVVDIYGTPETTLVSANPERIIRTKNEKDTASFAFAKGGYTRAQVMALGKAAGVREVQIYRDSDLMFWGPMLHPSAVSDRGGVIMACAGVDHYLDQRLLDGQRTNRLTDASFEAGTLAAWTISGGLTATQDTTRKVLGTKSLKLVNASALADRYASQSFTETAGPIGTFFVIVGYFLIDAMTGPAVDSRGLYVEGIEGGVSQYVGYYPIDTATFAQNGKVWVRVEVPDGIHVPANKTWTINVRAYGINGTIYWDALQVVAMESVSTAGITGTVDGEVDIGRIMELYVRHLQNTAVGKSDVNIGTNCATVGVTLSKHVQYVEHVDWPQAKGEFTGRDDGIDVWVEITPTTRSLTTATRKGADLTGTVTLTYGAGGFAHYTYDEDGGACVTRATYTGDGDGPDREEGEAFDTAGIGGLILQDVRAAPAKTQINSLIPLAQKVIDRYKVPPKILNVTVSQSAGLIHTVTTGDRIHVVINDGWVQVDGDYEVVRWELACRTSALTLTLNEEP